MRRALILAAIAVASCSRAPLDVGDLGVDLRAPAGDAGCAGSGPLCVHGCGSDFLANPECVAGAWQCPAGTVDASTCPPGTCWGPPAPGEVCGPNGWECRPDQTGAYTLCPQLMCPECTAFTGPTLVMGCRCECKGAQVLCVRLPDGGAPDLL